MSPCKDEREKCLKVIDAFAELYETTNDDIVVLDGGRYGSINNQEYGKAQQVYNEAAAYSGELIADLKKIIALAKA